MSRLVLIGASGHGKVCAEIAELNRYTEILFLDDSPLVKKCGNYDVVGTGGEFYGYINDVTDFFVSIGNLDHRRNNQERIEKAGGRIATLIHPNATISDDAELGAGTVVMAGAVINAWAKIGKGVIVNTSSSIDHDCVIGDYCHISVGAHVCGTVTIGDKTWVGAGATVRNNIEICGDAFIGTGAVIVKNIEEKGMYIGVPAMKK